MGLETLEWGKLEGVGLRILSVGPLPNSLWEGVWAERVCNSKERRWGLEFVMKERGWA